MTSQLVKLEILRLFFVYILVFSYTFFHSINLKVLIYKSMLSDYEIYSKKALNFLQILLVKNILSTKMFILFQICVLGNFWQYAKSLRVLLKCLKKNFCFKLFFSKSFQKVRFEIFTYFYCSISFLFQIQSNLKF